MSRKLNMFLFLFKKSVLVVLIDLIVLLPNSNSEECAVVNVLKLKTQQSIS